MGARFICEHCGASVKRDSKSCPQCGRPFANVLCPVCGFEGAERLFSAGCPSCGYTAEAPVRVAASKHEKEPPPRFVAGDLPVWAYVLAILAFVSVLALLLKYLR
ncbi:hypothetical protein AGMMS49944_26450 [Spirochaetia bacterium]|nr:hypothetical protein AGMMS49944_26450 [Spirochaetia bacterium]